MKKSTLASLLTFAVVTVVGIAYIALSVLQYKPLADYKQATMRLDDASQLLPGSRVLLRGIKVGQVREITRDGNKVLVNLRYEGQYDIPESTGVKIEQLSAVGESFIDFLPESLAGPYYADNATIETSKIREPMAIPEIFKLISSLTSSINSADLGGITTTLAQATGNTAGALPNLQAAGDILAQTITSRMPSIRRLFENTQIYQADMAWLPGALTGFGAGAGTFVEKLSGVISALDLVVTNAENPGRLQNSVNPFLFKIAPDASTLLANLGPITEPLVPVVQAVTDVLPQIDFAALLSQALNTVGSDGAANLTVVIPPK